MNKLPKEKRDKLILVVVGTIGIFAALYLSVVNTQHSALAEYADQTEAAKEKLAKAERWLRMGPAVQAKLSACRRELEQKQESMAPVDKFKWFYNTLDQFLAHHHVRLVDITREPEIGELGSLPKFPYQAASFGVKLSARYHDFGAFLADFENQFPDMRVQNLELQPEASPQAMAPGGKDARAVQHRPASAETLTITMRVVTLIKPSVPL